MTPTTPDQARPRHVAIIMDGNGRWAKKRRLGRIRGHRAGISAVREIVKEAVKHGVEYLTLFTFSSENWGRPSTEVKALMALFIANFERETPLLKEQGVRMRVAGDRTRLPRELLAVIERSEKETENCKRLTLVLAISYGGRDEILNAVKKLIASGISPDQIDENTFRNGLYLPDVPDPDLLIRTSGECRISNFLLWQLAYTELYITEVLWPDFGAADFTAALEAYGARQRRFGLTDEQLAGQT